MRIFLTKKQADLVLESLEYSLLRFQEYNGYPSAEFKKRRIDEVNEVKARIHKSQKK